MNDLTADDIENAARRAGWNISRERAVQIAATAAPRIAAFDRVRPSLTLDDEVSFGVALHEARYQERDGS